MSFRLVVASVLVAPSIASASPLSADLSAGAGAAVMYSDPCGGPFPIANCTTPAARLRGPAMTVRGMVGAHHALRGAWGLRWGAGLSGLFMTESGDTGSIVSGGGEFGVTLDRWSADTFAGLSWVRVRADGMATTGATMAFGGSVGFAITPQVSAFARVDLSAMLEGSIGGASIDGGVTFRL